MIKNAVFSFGTTEAIAVSGVAAVNTVHATRARTIRVIADTDVKITPSNATGSFLLPAKTEILLNLAATHTISIVTVSGSGTAYVSDVNLSA